MTINRLRNIVKVRYFSETTGELSAREYTYYSVEPLKVGDIAIVPVRDSTGKAKVSAVNVPEAEIAAFADKVKTIPADSKVESKENPPELSAVGAELFPDNGGCVEPEEHEAESHNLDLLLSRKAVAIVNISPEHDQAVTALYQESLSILAHAEALAITKPEDMKLATDDISLISKVQKAIEAKRKEYVNPIRQHLDAINAAFKDFTAPLNKADTITREKIKTYNLDQQRKQREQEQINNLRMEAAQKEAALNQGELSEPVQLVEVVASPKKVVTDLGSAAMRDNWTYQVTDFKLVPDEYKIVNASALNAFIKSNKDTRPIPGVRIYNDPVVVVRPK
ncbi:MAG: hypothetical protein PHG35_03410 [Dehalococcoidales bacterium]|nr:hypothetical protein [Dehalococcoidales bacterium]